MFQYLVLRILCRVKRTSGVFRVKIIISIDSQLFIASIRFLRHKYWLSTKIIKNQNFYDVVEKFVSRTWNRFFRLKIINIIKINNNKSLPIETIRKPNACFDLFILVCLLAINISEIIRKLSLRNYSKTNYFHRNNFS